MSSPSPFGTAPSESVIAPGAGTGPRAHWARSSNAGIGPPIAAVQDPGRARAARCVGLVQVLPNPVTGAVWPLVFDFSDYDAMGRMSPAVYSRDPTPVFQGASAFTTYAPPVADYYRLHARVTLESGDPMASVQLRLATSLDGSTWTPIGGSESAIGTDVTSAVLDSEMKVYLAPQLGFTALVMTQWLRVRAELVLTNTAVAHLDGCYTGTFGPPVALTDTFDRPSFFVAARVQ